MWNRLSVVTAPATLAVTLADAKSHLRVDHADEDSSITAMIEAAAAMIDGPDGIGYALQEQVWLMTLDKFGCSSERTIVPLRPVVSIDEIRYLDGDGIEQTIDAEDYRVSRQGGTAIITPVSSWPSPLDVPGSVRIEFTAGTGTPPALRAAILLMVGHLYANREAVADNKSELPLAWSALTNKYRSGMVAA